MIKNLETKFSGMSKDLSNDLQSDKYFDARNIRIMATDKNTTLAMTNEKGTSELFSIPTPYFNSSNTEITYQVNSSPIKSLSYLRSGSTVPGCDIENDYAPLGTDTASGTQVIVGVKALRDSAIVLSTDGAGFDCVWELTGIDTGNFDITLLYMRNLGFEIDRPIQILFNYENSIIQKIYLVDGKHQIRHMNIKQSTENGDSLNLIDVKSTSLDSVGTFDLSQPEITGVFAGGGHTSGMIQYAYNLYVLNGSQTTISPLSELEPIDKGPGLGGGEVNEVLGRSVTVKVNDLDTQFTNIRIYSIKYTSYNQIPEIKIVADKEIDSTGSFSYTDDGVGGESISLEQFIFLGSSPIVPKHIASKDNRLFPINITELNFDVNVDCRSYSHDSSGQSVIIDSPYIQNDTVYSQQTTIVPSDFIIPESHDCINKDYDVYKYQSDGTTLGASGPMIEVEFDKKNLTDGQARGNKYFKDRELYRLGVKFYNRRGQTSDPKWIMDFISPGGNLEGDYVHLKVKFKSEFYVWLNDSSNFSSEDDKPVGYKILRADRKLSDQTILSQGMINGTVANFAGGNHYYRPDDVKGVVDTDKSVKMPSLTRTFERIIPILENYDYLSLSYDDSGEFGQDAFGTGAMEEVYKSTTSQDRTAQTFQHGRLMQMFGPDITFRDIRPDASYKLRVLGLAESSYVGNWGTETDVTTGNNINEVKYINGLDVATEGVSFNVESGNPSDQYDRSFFGPTNGDNSQGTFQIYREFRGGFIKSNTEIYYDIYGSPEITEVGADYTPYNNDYNLKYCNHLKDMLQDGYFNSDHVERGETAVRGCNSNGGRCITFAEGPDSSSYDIAARKSIVQMYNDTGISETNGVLIAEFVKDSSQLYVGNMYGGNSYESKRNSDYIEIGSYSDIIYNETYITSPGDTFVDTFITTKLIKDDVQISSTEYSYGSEIVSFRVESSIDLINRNDLSIGEWDNRWQPRYDEYQKYNYVYSQQPTLIISSDVGVKFKKVKEFDTRIIATKEKIPGEFIDSWTDFLENETMDLDGSYGPINGVVNFKDNIFCIQDNAVSAISINPRVQTQGSDGLSIELGTGSVLHDNNYLSTSSGTLNKFSLISTDNAFYFIDVINKSISVCNGGQVNSLSDVNGLHSEMVERIDRSTLTRVSVGYDSVNNTIYFTFQQDYPFTISYNEVMKTFICFHDYTPEWYIHKGDVMISTGKNTTDLHQHFVGKPNEFYGDHFRSSITFKVAPQGDEIIMNGASYKQELRLNGVETKNESLTKIRVYNDYQDSGDIELKMRKNLFNKFKNWKVTFPRDNNTRDRVRGAWGFAEFIFDNTDGKDLILHNITIYYTQH